MDGKRKLEGQQTGSNKKPSKFSDAEGAGKSQAELLQEQIAMQLAAVSTQLEQAKRASDVAAMAVGGDRKPSSMMLDADGNIVDADGNKIQGKTEFKTVTTLKANVNEPKKKFVNPYLAHKTVEIKDKNTQMDVNVHTTNHEGRKKKSLQFVRQGTYVKQADTLRFKEARKIVAGFSSGRNKRGYDTSGISSVGLGLGDVAAGGDKEEAVEGSAGLALGEFEVPRRPDADQDVPLCEWWDVAFLPKAKRPLYEAAHRAWLQGKKYKDAVHPPVTAADLAVKNAREHPYIQHPVPIQQISTKEVKPLQLMLTKKETKKIRRQRRAERRAFVQDQILMGLAEAPAPKMKISNMYRIMGAEGVADPSKLEAQVKEEVAQRLKNHEMRNLARKLTPAEKKEKKRKKLMEDTTNEVRTFNPEAQPFYES
jgi:U4/U6 small nuclear ribonucleoprotein PRP3